MTGHTNVEVNDIQIIQDDGTLQLIFEEHGYEVTVEVHRNGVRRHLDLIEDESVEEINEQGAVFVGKRLQQLGSIGVAAEPSDEKWDELADMEFEDEDDNGGGLLSL